MTRNTDKLSVCFLNRVPLKFAHVGEPIWMYRIGRVIPGNYTGFFEDRPATYTGRVRVEWKYPRQ
jgi:hypothetical protein